MAVRFSMVRFRNRSPDLTLTIEAPIGTFVHSEPIPGNTARDLAVGIDNCPSALLIVTSSSHPEYRQAFEISTPVSGRQSYLKALYVQYSVGDFEGTFEGATESRL